MHHAWVLHRARSVLIVKKVLVPGLFNSISNLVREHNSKLKNYWNRNHLQKNFKIHKLVESKLLNLQIANHWSQSLQLLSVLKSLASDHPRHKKRQVMKKIRQNCCPLRGLLFKHIIQPKFIRQIYENLSKMWYVVSSRKAPQAHQNVQRTIINWRNLTSACWAINKY